MGRVSSMSFFCPRNAGSIFNREIAIIRHAGRQALPQPKIKRLYLIPILSKALDILELLEAEKKPLTLELIYQRSAISKTSVYRILKTFVHRGYVAQTQDGAYRLVSAILGLRHVAAMNEGLENPVDAGLRDRGSLVDQLKRERLLLRFQKFQN